jgi:2-polyprenyl-3-methyl-5-hydroxy-6-metoxy-1,4-benzoquinol methylase
MTQLTPGEQLRQQFGDIDIYLFDQLLRGRVRRGMRVLDAGCGGGRNLVYLLREGFDVSATDASPEAVQTVRRMATALAPALPASNFRVEPVERCSSDDETFDVVISNAVLHFAQDDGQFLAMVAEMWRVLKRGGVLFSRLASSIGIEPRVRPLGNNRFVLPDESERYLVSEAALLQTTRTLGGTLLDPLKTTIVQDRRAMTTWVVGK